MDKPKLNYIFYNPNQPKVFEKKLLDIIVESNTPNINKIMETVVDRKENLELSTS